MLFEFIYDIIGVIVLSEEQLNKLEVIGQVTCRYNRGCTHSKGRYKTMNYLKKELPIEERIDDLLSRMTLREKAAQTMMIHGIDYAIKKSPKHICCLEPDTGYDEQRLRAEFSDDGIGFVADIYSEPKAVNTFQKYVIENSRLGIPVIFAGEALHGVFGIRGTVFPCPINFGATFNPKLVRKCGEAIGAEARALGIPEILAPNLDIAREPRWGRLEETFGEDPYLAACMGEAIISGEQKGDISRPDAVVTEPKHYLAYGIPEGGVNCANARAGRREVETEYLPVFEAAVKRAGAYNMMASYNAIDGVPMMASKYYLTDVLKDRMGLKGYVRSDFNGVNYLHSIHRVATSKKDAVAVALNSGLDVQGCCGDLPASEWKQYVVELVQEGRIPMERLDDICTRVLRVKFELGLFDNPYVDETLHEKVVHCETHQEISLQAARESVTLIKNDGILPLKEGVKSIALIGPNSNYQQIGGYSSVPQFHRTTVYEELQKALGEKVDIKQYDGCCITRASECRPFDPIQPHLAIQTAEEMEENLEKAVELAAACELIVMVGGDDLISSGEGNDYVSLSLAGKQRELIEHLAALGKPLVLVLNNGRALELSVENECCNAILMGWFGGEHGAKAIVEALTGELNPAGRLPVSLPRHSGAIPCYYSMLPGPFWDYKDTTRFPLYAFGHGLSYTTFEYENLQFKQKGIYDFEVSCTVKNTGDRDGDEVVQLYIDDVASSAATPPLQLRGFERIHIPAKQEREVVFDLNEDAFRLFGPDYQWRVEAGEVRILVGAGSGDIRLEGQIWIV